MKASKYGNHKTEFNGRTYDSKAEARRAQELELMQAAGEISDLEYQPAYELHACADGNTNGITRSWYPAKVGVYRADFRYVVARDAYYGGKRVAAGTVIVEDVKGGKATQTQLYRWKKRHVRMEYQIDICEVEA